MPQNSFSWIRQKYETNLVWLGLERRLADEELVAKDSEGPKVDLLVVRGAFHHLRRQVVERSAHGGAAGRGRVNAPPEVGDLQVALHVQEQVFRLDVAMNDLKMIKQCLKSIFEW